MRLEVKIKSVMHKDSKSDYKIFKGQVIGSPEFEAGEEKHKKAIQRNMIFKGKMTSCSVGDTYIINAKLDASNKYGLSLLIDTAILKKIELQSELERYLEKHVKGVGKKTATDIVEKLGVGAIDKIKADDGVETLLEVLGHKKEKLATTIREHIIYNSNIFSIMEFLQIHGLPVKIANEILEEYGNDKLINLRDNPYFFIRCIDFKELDGVASKYQHIDKYDMNRLSAGVVAIVNNNTKNNKDVYTHINDIYENLESFINNNGYYEPVKLTKERIKEITEYALQHNMIACENNEFLYITYLRNKENDVAYHIRRLNKQCRKVSTKEILDLIKEYEDETGLTASDEQKEAVIKAIQNGFSVLTGLPGAGKTFTINLVIRIYLKLYPEARIKTLAPTGKASKRMSDMTGIKAETIHRALKINDFTKEVQPLDHDLIIVDEVSMLDIYVAGTLFSAIEDGCKVLIVGDIEQLPSIGAGLILRDIIDSNVVPVTRLTKLFRQAEDSLIVHNSHAIAKETYDFKWDNDKKDKNERKVIMWEPKATTEEEIMNNLLIGYKRFLSCGIARDSIGMLVPVNNGALGTIEINKQIQQKINMNAKSVIINEAGDVLKINDIVMQTVNNYDKEIFNGETGMIKSVEYRKDDNGAYILNSDGLKDIRVMVDFGGEELIEYDIDSIKELNLAYCITIHKSQGSEYQAVMCLIHDSHQLMLDKNLIYTGWTRAKDRLVVLGKQETLLEAVKRKDSVQRKSNLKAKLNRESFSKTTYIKEYENKSPKTEMEYSYTILGYDEDGDELF